MTTTTDPPAAPAAAREIAADASVAAFLVGGIGAGNISIGARGELRDWEIFNRPAKGNKLPYTFFALRIAPQGAEPKAKILESRLRPPHESWTGYPPGALAGLPRFLDSRMRGAYPFVSVAFIDDELPIAASLEAFTPLIPLDAEASSLPAALFRYRIRNLTDAAMEVTVAASLFNPIGCEHEIHEYEPISDVDGIPNTDYRVDGDLQGILMSSSLPSDNLRHGTLALLTAGSDVTATPRWPITTEAISAVWQDLEADGRLERTSEAGAPLGDSSENNMPMFDVPEKTREAWAKRHAAALASKESLAAREEQAFEFVIAWHFPNRSRSWTPSAGVQLLEPTNADQIVRNHYATRFEDAWAVGRHLIENLPSLEAATRTFHDGLYSSTLPPEVVDAATTSIAALRSTTCFWLEDGTFAGWEGCADDSGCGAGSCTHVWNYAQTAAFLFPELEWSMRKVEFALETDDSGCMQFRSNRVFGGKPWNFLPAVDGQLGSIIRLYREWKFSGDDARLAELWPNAAKALEFAFDYWDIDGDFVLEGRQHNTYDIEFHGPNPLGNAMFYTALRAGAAVAEYLGESDRANRYRQAAERGAARMDELLWNGEYYVQVLDDVDEKPHQHGIGCLSDQLLGQLAAHVTGLGYVLPREHVRQAISSVHRYNFRYSFRGHLNFLRTYALEDEAGLLLCTWPHGGRPRRAFGFSDEVWTGVEYQVAAHLIYEGLVDEGLEIVRGVRDRHDGYRRSPWNEAEYGNHYARSLSSWALLLAYSGFRYDATRQAIAFAPVVAGDFSCFFSTGTGWGSFERTSGSAQLRLQHGSLVLSHFDVDGVSRTFNPVTLSAGDILPFA